ncbi:hypothetical protein M0R45_030667 [Rubus argutus]|uniref:Uncharacterized protein n=1 Tax=Rubus argutus TaxID=59490 RepID=A0AAW1WDT5_RUBAR
MNQGSSSASQPNHGLYLQTQIQCFINQNSSLYPFHASITNQSKPRPQLQSKCILISPSSPITKQYRNYLTNPSPHNAPVHRAAELVCHASNQQILHSHKAASPVL